MCKKVLLIILTVFFAVTVVAVPAFADDVYDQIPENEVGATPDASVEEDEEPNGNPLSGIIIMVVIVGFCAVMCVEAIVSTIAKKYKKITKEDRYDHIYPDDEPKEFPK